MSDNLSLLQETAREILGNQDLELDQGQLIADIPHWDSFATVQIILAIENQESVQFDTVDVANIKKIGDIVEMMNKLI